MRVELADRVVVRVVTAVAPDQLAGLVGGRLRRRATTGSAITVVGAVPSVLGWIAAGEVRVVGILCPERAARSVVATLGDGPGWISDLCGQAVVVVGVVAGDASDAVGVVRERLSCEGAIGVVREGRDVSEGVADVVDVVGGRACVVEACCVVGA